MKNQPAPEVGLSKHIPADRHLPVKLTQDPLSRPDYGGYARDQYQEEESSLDDSHLENTELYKRLHEGLRTVENLILSSPFHQEAEFGTGESGMHLQEEVGGANNSKHKYSQNLGRAEFGSLRKRDNSTSSRMGDNIKLEQAPTPTNPPSYATKSRDHSRDRHSLQKKRSTLSSQQSSQESSVSKLSDTHYPDLENTMGNNNNNNNIVGDSQARTRRAHSFGPSQAVLDKKKAVLENIAQRKQVLKEAKNQMLVILLLGLCICIMIYLQTEEF